MSESLAEAAGAAVRVSVVWVFGVTAASVFSVYRAEASPDLQVDPNATISSLRVSIESFNANDCAVQEGCVEGLGARKLLRFDGSIVNTGDEDLVLGNPAENPEFEYSACHKHYHLGDIMKYELLDARNFNQVAVGRKQGFCMEDFLPLDSAGSPPAKYDCKYQGLTPGWADLYESSLDCQWLDITSLPSGQYLLKVTVNPEGKFSDSDLSNNEALIPVTIP